MSEQIAQDASFSVPDLGAKFGGYLAQLYAEIITLEKRLAAQSLALQEKAKNEERLQRHIQDAEGELSALKADNFEIETELATQALIVQEKAEDSEKLKGKIQELEVKLSRGIEEWVVTTLASEKPPG